MRTLKNTFMGLMTTGMMLTGGIKSAMSQVSTSISNPVKEVVENAKSIMDNKTTKEPDMVWFYGGAGNALDYSMDHNVIAFSMTVGADAPYADEQIAKMMAENVFQGAIDAPIAVFIEEKKVKGAKGMASHAYIRGERFISDYEDKNQTASDASILSAPEIVKYAPEMVNKLNDHTRVIGNASAFLYNYDKD